MNLLNKYSKFTICNFFLIFLIIRIINIFVLKIDLYVLQLFFVINAIFGLSLILCRTNKCIMNFLVLLFILYNIINGILIYYPHHDFLFYKACISEISAIFFYFIGKNVEWNIDNILKQLRFPLLFAAFCGIYFFFFMPSWYLSMKESLLEDTNAYEGAVGEIFRLSSFWGHPYQLGYAIAIFSSYSIVNSFINSHKIYYIFISIFLFLVLVLCQLRVCILYYLLVFIYHYFTFGKSSVFVKILSLTVFSIIMIIIVFYFFNTLSGEQSEYIINHTTQLFESEAVNNRLEHTSGGLNNDIFDSFFGYGVGHFSQNARDFGIPALVDCEYQKKIAELGLCGFSIFILIIIVAIVKILKNFDNNTCANSIVLFYVIASIGASCISNVHQYPYMFWFALGCLFNSNNNLKRNNNE